MIEHLLRYLQSFRESSHHQGEIQPLKISKPIIALQQPAMTKASKKSSSPSDRGKSDRRSRRATELRRKTLLEGGDRLPNIAEEEVEETFEDLEAVEHNILRNSNAWAEVPHTFAYKELFSLLDDPDNPFDMFDPIFTLYPNTRVTFHRLPNIYSYTDGSNSDTEMGGELLDYVFHDRDKLLVFIRIAKQVTVTTFDKLGGDATSPIVRNDQEAVVSSPVSNSAARRAAISDATAVTSCVWLDFSEITVLPTHRSSTLYKPSIKATRGDSLARSSPFIVGMPVHYRKLPRGCHRQTQSLNIGGTSGVGVVQDVEVFTIYKFQKIWK